MIKRYADKFFEWFCNPDYYPDIKGDLEELYNHKSLETSKRKADLFYARQVLLLLRLSLIRPIKGFQLINPGVMLKWHFKSAWRNLIKNSTYSFINILGLAIGLGACILVFCYTYSESSYDTMHPDVDRLYRVNQTAIWTPQGGMMASTAPPVAKALKDEFHQIEAVTRVNTLGNQQVRYQKSPGELLVFNEAGVLAADSNFFDFFAFPLKEGNPQTALKGVGKVVLSEEMAQKYFGDEPALGKILEFGDQKMPLEVSGVTAAQADNMHFHFGFLWSMQSNKYVEQFDWSYIWTQMVTYVKVFPDVDPLQLERAFVGFADKQVQPTFSRLGMDYKDFVADKGGWNFYLQPVRDIHLQSTNIGNRLGPIGNLQIINILKYVALLILLIATLNFINLATARASTRAKEIGVKKTIGAPPGSLISQFLVESILITTFSTLLALGFMEILNWLIFFLSGISIDTYMLFSWPFFLGLLLLPLGVGLLAGIYPALYLSAFQPMNVLKGISVGNTRKGGLRNALVTAQFAISIALMSGTILIYQQLNFLNSQNLGYDESNILVINRAEQLGPQVESFRAEVAAWPSVVDASIGMDMPGRGMWEDIYEREGSNIKLPISQYKIDESYFSTLGLTLKSGRKFDISRPGDVNGLIINETTERLFDWEEGEALGQQIIYPGFPNELTVIGIVKDFHFQSLRQPITPMMFVHIDSDLWGDRRVIALKYSDINQDQLLARLEAQWQKMAPDTPFSYSFFDDELIQMYQQESGLSGLISIFTGFSLFIALIGLIGLLIYAAEQRKKEIGIRKALGASIFQIFLLLNQQYVKLLFIALILAVPIAWTTMQNWLDSFAYGIDINVGVFIIAWVVVLVFCVLSVSYFSLKAAHINVATVLKDE